MDPGEAPAPPGSAALAEPVPCPFQGAVYVIDSDGHAVSSPAFHFT